MVRNNDSAWLGQTFGRLTVIGFTRAKSPDRGWWWSVRCSCGKEKVVRPGDVKSGKTRSCGCFHDERCRERAIKFYHRVKDYPRLITIYRHIRERCYDPRSPRYADYGGRGITMCREWADRDRGFDAFAGWALANGYSENLTIDREDVNGDYSPENCRWVTNKVQALNKRQTRWVVYRGEKIQLMHLCARIGVVSYDTAHDRIYARGWPVEAAVETPSLRSQKSFSQLCREHGLHPSTVKSRVSKFGWSLERALSTPTVGRGANCKSYEK